MQVTDGDLVGRGRAVDIQLFHTIDIRIVRGGCDVVAVGGQFHIHGTAGAVEGHPVSTRTTFDVVFTIASGEDEVVAVATTDQGVSTDSASQRVEAVAAIDRVLTQSTGDVVVAHTTVEGVGAVTTDDRIVAIHTVDGVCG